jgi:hypothetical protein
MVGRGRPGWWGRRFPSGTPECIVQAAHTTVYGMQTAPMRIARLAIVSVVGAVTATRSGAQTIPSRLADTTFWRMVNQFSEPGGYFRSDNFVSNETSFQWIIPELQSTIKPGGVYLGVAPDQNFTYLVALKPKIAFIVDIRHQNAMQHLMYKAILELSTDRAEFVSRLFSKPRPAGVDNTSTATALFLALAPGLPDSALYRKNLTAIKDRLTKVHGFALNEEELKSLEYVYNAFYQAGPNLTYNFGAGMGGYGGGGFARGMPNYQQLMMESDGAGQSRSYLATEENFRVLKDLEERNLIVPLTGNFAGDKALRAVGQWVREHGGRVTTFYTSNVEQYLFQDGISGEFYKNVATMPIDSTSTFIRSFTARGGTWSFRQQSPYSNSFQLMSRIADQLKAFSDGKLTDYYQVIGLSRQ